MNVAHFVTFVENHYDDKHVTRDSWASALLLRSIAYLGVVSYGHICLHSKASRQKRQTVQQWAVGLAASIVAVARVMVRSGSLGGHRPGQSPMPLRVAVVGSHRFLVSLDVLSLCHRRHVPQAMTLEFFKNVSAPRRKSTLTVRCW